MKTLKFDSREKWLEARLGKITGSRLKDVATIKNGRSARKMAYYELIAERLTVPEEGAPEGEHPMDRGLRLEPDALARFAKEHKKKVDASLVIWMRDDNEGIAISPDGIVGKTEAVETKCLGSALHIKTYLTQEIPSEYEEQGLQYFIVNDKLKKLHFAFYDPRIPAKDFFTITIERKDVQAKVDEYLAFERAMIAEVEAEVTKLIAF